MGWFPVVSKRVLLFGFLMLGLILGLVQSAAALPPKHEMNRLLIAAESSLGREEWGKALASLQKIESLGIDPPIEFHYYYGKVLAHEGQYEQAMVQLEQYVVDGGEEAEFYRSSLMLLTEAQDQLASQQKIQPHSSITYSTGSASQSASGSKQYQSKVKSMEPPSRDEYLKSLRKLYLVSNDQQALVLHINAILADHPYYGARIKKAKRESGVDVQVEIGKGNDLILKEKHYSAGGRVRLNVTRQSVFGLDPIIRYGCNMGSLQCWLYHPVHSTQHWILMDRDEQAAAELALAMSRLIRLLQQ